LQQYVYDFAATLEGSEERPVKYVDPEETDVFLPDEPAPVVAPKPAVRRTRARTTRPVPQPSEEEAVSEP